MRLSNREVRFYHDRSMAGTFRPGDYLTVVPLGFADIRPGDLVVYFWRIAGRMRMSWRIAAWLPHTALFPAHLFGSHEP